MKVLLSIKPEYVARIFSGEKKFEYRRSIFKRRGVDVVVIYSTMPVGKIVGEFAINGVITSEPQDLWKKTSVFSGISKDKFQSYFNGKDKGHAICIGNFVKYNEAIDPLEQNPSFIPPQSFRYLD